MNATEMNQGEYVLSLTDEALAEWLGEDGVELQAKQHTAESLDRLRKFGSVSVDPDRPNWGYVLPHEYVEPTCPYCGEPCGGEPRGHIECRAALTKAGAP